MDDTLEIMEYIFERPFPKFTNGTHNRLNQKKGVLNADVIREKLTPELQAVLTPKLELNTALYDFGWKLFEVRYRAMLELKREAGLSP